MVRRATLLLFFSVGVGAVSCAALIEIGDPSLDPGVALPADAGDSTSSADAQPTSDVDVPDASCPSGFVTCPGDPMPCTKDVTTFQTDTKSCGRCGHDCLGGACTAGTCGVVRLATAQNNPTHLAIDDDSVYWVTSAGNSSAKISFCPKTSACATPGTLSPALPVTGLAGTKNALYWSGGTPLRILTCPKPLVCATGTEHAALTGSSATDLLPDELGGRLFFFAGGDVMKVPLAAGGIAEPIVPSSANPKSLVYDGASLFWATSDDVVTCALPACAASTIVVTNDFVVDSVAVDGVTLYHGTGNVNDKVQFGPKLAGSTSADFAPGDRPVARSGTIFFFAGAVLHSCAGGSACAAPTILARAPTTITQLRVDGAAVYFVAGGEIFRVAY